MKILFADDEAWAYKSLVTSLRQAGHQVAVSQWDATWILIHLGANVTRPPLPEYLQSSGIPHQLTPPPPYDLLILDIMMPVGFEGEEDGVLEERRWETAGLGVYEAIREKDLGWPDWVPRMNVLVFTADNSASTYDEMLALKNTREGDNFEIVYKPGGDVLGQVSSFQNRISHCGATRG